MADPVVIPDDIPVGEGGEDVEMEGPGESEEAALPEDAAQTVAQRIAFLE